RRTQVPAAMTTAKSSPAVAEREIPRNNIVSHAADPVSRAISAGAGVPRAPSGGAQASASVAGGLLGSLKPSALKLLRYFRDNPGDRVRFAYPGDRVRFAANVFGVETREINQILYGPLKGMLTQDGNFGWRLTDAARKELDALDEQERGS